mmetsp:Transcript_11697/g.31498  ORF Transcript_11697/g.31498 Transcript_11697/m.31498 type:complete len:235 (+) Transcript_11697:2157-2861(+)
MLSSPACTYIQSRSVPVGRRLRKGGHTIFPFRPFAVVSLLPLTTRQRDPIGRGATSQSVARSSGTSIKNSGAFKYTCLRLLFSILPFGPLLPFPLFTSSILSPSSPSPSLSSLLPSLPSSASKEAGETSIAEMASIRFAARFASCPSLTFFKNNSLLSLCPHFHAFGLATLFPPPSMFCLHSYTCAFQPALPLLSYPRLCLTPAQSTAHLRKCTRSSAQCVAEKEEGEKKAVKA